MVVTQKKKILRLISLNKTTSLKLWSFTTTRKQEIINIKKQCNAGRVAVTVYTLTKKKKKKKYIIKK